MGFLSAIIENLPSLPPREARGLAQNPIAVVRSLSWLQLAFFVSGWFAWLCDAIDFFAVSLSVTRLTKTFAINGVAREASSITQSITLTLLFRPAGAIVFGLLSDRYGRKWPLIGNLLIVSALSLGTGFVQTFQQFLAVRSLFGIGMGGIWGQAASLSLENMPVEARGLFSGLLQQGYAVGYLIAAVINLTAVAHYNTWRVLFYIGSGISLAAAFIRLLLPESVYFSERQRAAKDAGSVTTSSEKTKMFFKEGGRALKEHWVRCIFAVLLMTGFNFYSHGSQDLYPTYIQTGKGLGANRATVATIIGNCGAVAGGTIAGGVSQILGRRLTIIVMCIWTCIWLPLWLLPTTFGPLAAGAFFVQFGVQGAWGVIPVYLTEISPVAFRAFFPGVAYQLGNMISAASSQIEAKAGENLKTKEGLPDYGKVSAILIGVVSIWIIFFSLIGREAHSSHFEKGRAAFEQGGGVDVIEDDAMVGGSGRGKHHQTETQHSDSLDNAETEKGHVVEKETVDYRA